MTNRIAQTPSFAGETEADASAAIRRDHNNARHADTADTKKARTSSDAESADNTDPRNTAPIHSRVCHTPPLGKAALAGDVSVGVVFT